MDGSVSDYRALIEEARGQLRSLTRRWDAWGQSHPDEGEPIDAIVDEAFVEIARLADALTELQKLVEYSLATINAVTERAESAEHERDRALEQRDLAEHQRDKALAALQEIREATNLALPSEQTGPEWEQCVRVPVARMATIDAAVASVLGDPPVTNEPKPALHGAESGVPTKRVHMGRTNPRRTGP